MSEIQRFDLGEDNFRNTWGMTSNADGAWVTYADHAAEVARLTAPKLPAMAYFDLRGAEDGLDDAICRAFGCDPDDSDAWPFVDMWYDSYDDSFEVAAKDVNWRPSMDKWNAAFALGFQRGWINFADGTELYCVAGAAAPFFGKALWPRLGTPGERRFRVANRKLNAEVARLQKTIDELMTVNIPEDTQFILTVMHNERRLTLEQVRARIAEFDPESKPFIADEIHRILDEVGNDTHTTKGKQP